MVDHYALLGVAREASDEEVRGAIARLANRCRQGKTAPSFEVRMESERLEGQLAEAKRVLLDPRLKSEYDRQLPEPGLPGPVAEPDPHAGQKQCPACAEWIRLEARKCRYCGEFLEPHSPSGPLVSAAPTTEPAVVTAPAEPAAVTPVARQPASASEGPKPTYWIVGSLLVVAIVAWMAMGYQRSVTPVAPVSQPDAYEPVAVPTEEVYPLTEETPLEEAPAPEATPDDDVMKEQIREVLEEWRGSLADADLERHMACYADELRQYFRKSGVPQQMVRADKQRFFDIYTGVREFELSDLDIQLTASDEATVYLTKTWNCESTRRRFSGSVRERLRLSNVDGWRIVGEEELEVYNVQREAL